MDTTALYLHLVLVAVGFALGLETQRVRDRRARAARPHEGFRLEPDDHIALPVVAHIVEPVPEPARPALLEDLSQAMARDELHLGFQPKLRARTGTIDSVEALVRWPHPAGDIPPDRFIGLAEEHDTIAELTRWVALRAVRDQAAMAAAGFDLTVYINLSAKLLPDRKFAAWLIDVLGHGRKIGLEVTETAMISDPDGALANLRAFADAGIRIAIDDYGAGFSSLAYLKQVPAQELKLDRMFISGLASSHRDPLLVRSTIDLAHALEMEVTAEGIESPAELALLRIMGCDLMQGFHISRALPLGGLIPFLTAHEQGLASKPHGDAVGFADFGFGRAPN